MKKLIIANWKMNPDSAEKAVLLARSVERSLKNIRNVEVVIAPPFPFMLPIAAVVKRATLGAQNVWWRDGGPYTGEVSWRQLKGMKVTHVIVGHSERKYHLGETDEMIGHKVRTLLQHGMTPILCVGETERVGDDIPQVVGEQIKAALKGIKKLLLKRLVIAYEPVWAISTNPHARPDTPLNSFRAMIYIRKVLSELYGHAPSVSIRIIYGGSVNAKNISAFLQEGQMQGALVGGASLDASEFINIVTTASQSKNLLL